MLNHLFCPGVHLQCMFFVRLHSESRRSCTELGSRFRAANGVEQALGVVLLTNYLCVFVLSIT